MHYDLKAFGEKLREIRINHNIKINQLKTLCNINRDTIRKLENGLVIPKIETLDRLTHAYKQDIYILFSKYRQTVDVYLNRVIKDISESFKNGDYSIIEVEVDKFKKYFIDSPLYSDDQIKLKANQFHLYLISLANINNTLNDQGRKNITDLFLSLNFSIKDLNNHSVILDKLEIRIIVLLATVYRYKNDFIRTIDLLELVRKELVRTYQDDKDFLYFYFLVTYNIMTYHYRLDNYDEALKIYRDSLSVLDNEIGVHNFSYYLIRIGINKHLSDDVKGESYISTALELLKDNGDKKLYDQLLKSLKNRYNILRL